MALIKTSIFEKGNLTAKDRRQIKRLQKQVKNHINVIENDFKAMKLPEKEGMFPSDDDFLIG